MNWQAVGALIGRELRRGRRQTIQHAGLLVVSIVLALTLEPETAAIFGALWVVFGAMGIMGPIGDLRTDKVRGTFDFDRALPVGHSTIGAARLVGATLRVIPSWFASVPLLIAAVRDPETHLSTLPALLITAAIAVLLVVVMWLFMAVNLRWNLRHLWWVPMTIAFTPTILLSALPASARATLARIAKAAALQVVAFASTTVGQVSFVAAGIAIPLSIMVLAVWLFASGLDRYRFEDSGTVLRSSKPPRRELGAVGRGPTLAVARYCLRLATEQSRRQLILLAIFGVLLVVGPGEIRTYARYYVRALAALLPGSIVFQLAIARKRGDLEGLQQLPHRPLVLGVGHLLALIALAIPGTAVWVLARAVTGMRPTVANVLTLFGWLVLWSWVAAVASVWLTTRRAMVAAAIPALGLAAWCAWVGIDRFVASFSAGLHQFAAFRNHAGAVLPLVLACVVAIAVMPLFVTAVRDYQPETQPRPLRWRRPAR